MLLATSIALVTHGLDLRRSCSAAQLALLLAAALGVGIARYYVLVSWATLVALWNYLRRGVPGDVGGGGGHAMNRALDIAIAGVGLVVTSPLLAAGRSP